MSRSLEAGDYNQQGETWVAEAEAPAPVVATLPTLKLQAEAEAPAPVVAKLPTLKRKPRRQLLEVEAEAEAVAPALTKIPALKRKPLATPLATPATVTSCRYTVATGAHSTQIPRALAYLPYYICASILLYAYSHPSSQVRTNVGQNRLA